MTRQEKIIALNDLLDDLEKLGNELDKTKKELYRDITPCKQISDYIKEDSSLSKKITYADFVEQNNINKRSEDTLTPVFNSYKELINKSEVKDVSESFTYITQRSNSNNFTKKMTRV